MKKITNVFNITVTLNYEEIRKNPQRITKNKEMNIYNWEGINYLSEKHN